MSVMQKTSEGWKRCDSKNGIAMDIYDSNERMIGIYDGKPLYRKKFHITQQIGGDVNIPHGLTNIKVTKIYGTARTTGNVDVPIPYVHTVAANLVGVFENGSSICFRLSSTILTDTHIILEYTKTTDSAIDINRLDIISQNLYDGEEHQIGMWFGKPLYRRTFDLGSNVEVSYTAWTSLASYFSIPNLKAIINSQGMNEGGTNYQVMCGRRSADLNTVEVQSGRNSYSVTLRYLTIEYTKTTD